MFRSIILVLVASLASGALESQQLYMPRNVKKAYEKGTRSLNGYPGPHYWQNTGRYDIHITSLPPDREISGRESITYINQSPDTLKTLVFKLIQNIHLPGTIRYGDQDSTYFTSGVHIDSFLVNGEPTRWMANPSHYTWQEERLAQPLMPGDSVHLDISWHFQISLKSGREGMIDSTTYYLAYFYPRVAVYDDYYGWDRLNFTDFQEFYNDFNDYTLSVTVPRNFIVWATGMLKDPGQVLSPTYDQKYEQSLTSDDIIRIATPGDLSSKQVTAQNSQNTWVFTASHITDMAIGLSDHYDWDGTSVVVDDATGRRASVQAAYNDTAADFHLGAWVGRYTLDWYSHHIPGVPYPFPKMTDFQGHADMEYPMMINDGTTKDLFFSRLVENHEIGHTYFPFYMGTNESRYGFMDEGWATTLEYLIGMQESSKDSADNFYRRFRVDRWASDPSAEEDLPIITPSNALVGISYGINAYGKPSLGYLAMKDLLGDELFLKCLHAYMERWHGKHPIPWDFFNSFNNASGMDLNWFWNEWFFSNGYIDLAVKGVQRGSNGSATVTIDNIGGFPAPFNLIRTYSDGTTDSTHYTPAIWKKDMHRAEAVLHGGKKISSVSLDMGIFVDADPSNNVWQATK